MKESVIEKHIHETRIVGDCERHTADITFVNGKFEKCRYHVINLEYTYEDWMFLKHVAERIKFIEAKLNKKKKDYAMTDKITITCDWCGREIEQAQHVHKDYLHLSQKTLAASTNMVYSVYTNPLLEDSKDFCGFGCLAKWLQEGNSNSSTFYNGTGSSIESPAYTYTVDKDPQSDVKSIITDEDGNINITEDEDTNNE